MDKNKDLLATKVVGNYRIKVYRDVCAHPPMSRYCRALYECPNNHGRHMLHKDCDWRYFRKPNGLYPHSLHEALLEVLDEHLPMVTLINVLKEKLRVCEVLRLKYNRPRSVWELQEKGEWDSDKCWKKIDEFESNQLRGVVTLRSSELIGKASDDSLVHMLGRYSNSLVLTTLCTRLPSDEDNIFGVVYCTKKSVLGGCIADERDWREVANRYAIRNANSHEIFLHGETKGYTIEKKTPYVKIFDTKDRQVKEGLDWVLEGTRWGCYKETDEVIDDVIKRLESNREAV